MLKDSPKRRAVFESDQILSIPEDKEGRYVLENEGVKYYGVEATKSIEATFTTVPFKSHLLLFEFNYDVTLQFQKNCVFVWFYYADLYQIYKWLATTFQARFRLKSVNPIYDLLKMEIPWPCNEEFLLFQFKHDPEETLSFVKAHLPELITIMSLNKVPRKFDEPFKFIRF